jgi:ABC transport system ATP-binding/permease protein
MTPVMAGFLLSLTEISITFGGDALLEGARLDVEPGARIALVGRNGSGKSTLLKIAAGAVEPDRGERFVHPGAAIRYLPQEPDFTGYKTAEDYIAEGLNDDADEHLIDIVMASFDLAPGITLDTCSGGEARRIAIAAALVSKPDILLLDEPTNHLDLPAIAELEKRLRASPSAIVLISHDRRFLENLTTATVWIDRGKTRSIARGFSEFEAWRDKTLEEEEQARHKLGRKIVAEEHWLRYGVTARRKRNMRRLGELHTMRKDLREARRPTGTVKFSKSETNASGKRVIVAEHISKAFGDNKVVNDFSVEITRGEKIGIVGPNGAGKTTLVNMLTGALAPDSGAIKLGTNLDLVSLDQRRASLKPEMRLADAIADERGDWVTIAGAKRHVASYLQDFLFAPEQWRAPVSSLSGGERGRLALASALAKPSNLLALDEPTNDLDLETLDLLEELLAAYQGTLLLISHDRSFLDRIVTSVITTDPDRAGGWRTYDGGYDDMVRQRGSAPGMRSAVKAPKQVVKRDGAKPQAQTKLSYKEKYALETLPAKISALEAKVKALNAKLNDAGFYDRDPQAFNQTASEVERTQTALAAAEEEWLALEIKREHLSQGRS